MCFWGWRFPYFWNGVFWNMPYMILFGLIFWIGIVLVIVYIIKNFYKSYRGNNKKEFLDILKKKLSTGEITSEEYEKLRKIILD